MVLICMGLIDGAERWWECTAPIFQCLQQLSALVNAYVQVVLYFLSFAAKSTYLPQMYKIVRQSSSASRSIK